jgi:Family of unknown function (DUF6152)
MSQKPRFLISSLVGMLSAFGTAPASAHHSFAMFDNSKEVALSGTVRQFQWTNPHCWIQLTVMVSGKAVDYSIEGTSPNNLTRRGWTRSALRVGDRVTIKIHPLRSGTAGGSFISATFANGRVLNGEPMP